MHASTPLARAIYNLDALTLSDLDGATPAQLRKLAGLCDHWHDLASIRLAERRSADAARNETPSTTPIADPDLPNTAHPLEAAE